MIRLHTRARWRFALLGILVASCGPGGLQTGIDGTGIHTFRDVVSYGRALTSGGLQVNRLNYDTAGAAVVINGAAATHADLQDGDIVFVEGRVELQTNRALADRIISDHAVQGRIQSIDAAQGQFAALGQTVKVQPQTVFESSIAAGLAGLAAGDAISVSGFRNVHGEIIATRIERMAEGSTLFRTTGAVDHMDLDEGLLQINDLLVSGNTILTREIVAALLDGAFVEVAGTMSPGSDMLVASSLAIRRQRMPGVVDSTAQLEGYLTALDASSSSRFQIDGLPVTTSPTTMTEGVLNVETRVEVSGSVSAAGAVLASTIHAGYTPPPELEQPISARVFEAGSGPIALARIDVWIQTNGFSYSLTWAQGGSPLISGTDGRVRIPAPDGALLVVNAYKDGYVQPCMVAVTAASGLSFDVELVAQATLDSHGAPPPQTATGTSVTGTVTEMVAGNPQPVPGASVWLGDSFGISYARTMTDRDGRYLVCNLPSLTKPLWPWATELWVHKAGYEDAIEWQVPTTQSSVRDFVMVRKP
jgi:hypothetical protein